MEFQDILFEKKGGVAKITINRPPNNPMRAQTHEEIVGALQDAELDPSVGVVVITGAGDKAFCTGGDVRGEPGVYPKETDYWHNLEHIRIRNIPKPVIAAVNGYAIGSGHVLHVLCDLTIASENARFGQTGPRIGSFDGGFGCSYLARVVGEKKAKEVWFLCRQYTAQEALQMGLVNKVVPLDKLEEEVDKWCQEILSLSPTALKFCKAAFNAETAHQYGFEAWNQAAVRLFWQTEEANEAKKAFKEKRKADFSRFR